MRKLIMLLVLGLALVAMASCTDTEMAKLTAYGNKHKIELLSCDGKVVRTFNTDGKVENPQGSDGYQFMDNETGKLTEVSGNVIVTTL